MQQQRQLGEIRLQRIVESVCDAFKPLEFFPETTPEDWKQHRAWMQPRAMHPASGHLLLTIQSFLVQTRHHTILVDTCVGDHKPRPHRPHWHMTQLDTFLPRLAQAGVTPEAVDYVMCTHLHWDHVGWNTRLHDGRWLPTFPNATYIFAKREWETWQQLHGDTPQPHLTDSILPVMEAGQVQLVENDFALDDNVWLEPTPGHTPDHVSVHLASQGARAIITGDLIHNPVQCLEPTWIMRADFAPQRATETRLAFLHKHSDTDTLICATHFPEPSIGHLVSRGDAFWFTYEE